MQQDRLFHSLRWLLAMSAIVTIAGGCRPAGGIQRVVVRGAVTLNGNPIEDGPIRYVPIGGTAGAATVVRIVGGKYVADDKGGAPVGKHRVEIRAWDPNLPPGGRGEPTRPQLVPEKYSENSELVETIEGRREVEKNFDLHG